MGSHQHRAYLARLCCVLRISHPLNALTPPSSVPTLFHAGSTHGVFPFRGFPSLKSVASSDARSPPDVSVRVPFRFQQQAVFHEILPDWSPSGVFPFNESVHPVPGVNPCTEAVPLLGFVPSKGLPELAIRPPSRPFLSHTLTPVRLSLKFGSPLPGVPESYSLVLWLVSEKTAVLPGVYSLFTFHILSKSVPPWLIVSPQVPEYVTASCRTLFGLFSLFQK